jgi:hypothetical protein
LGAYPKIDKNSDEVHFYEFMLDSKQLIKTIESEGFKLVLRHSHDAVKGLKDEVPLFRLVLQKIYDGRSIFAKVLRGLISVFIAPFAGHIILLVFRKI